MKLSKNWASHLPVLFKLLPLVDKEIVELGTGIYSTTFLHWWGRTHNIHVTSYEHEPTYYKRAKQHECELHSVIEVENWNDLLLDGDYGLVLIDHNPPERRHQEATKVIDADFVVLHDAQPKHDWQYHYSDIYDLYKYRYLYNKAYPNTCVLSNKIDVCTIFQS